MDSVARYVREIRRVYQTGTATEHSYRPALERLLSSIDNGVTVQNESRQIGRNAPDITLYRNGIAIGHVEAKDIDVDLSNLNDANKDQKKRYLASMDKLVYTNGLDWELYLNGALISEVSIATLKSGNIKSARGNFHKLKTLLNFLTQNSQSIASIENLVGAVAHRARLIRDNLKHTMREGTSHYKIFEFFKEHLIHDITPDAFADAYAETVTYGVLAARIHAKEEDFTRAHLKDMIPKSNPFLRGLFTHIAEDSLDCRIAGIIDDLVDVFKACDVDRLLENKDKGDPFLHFYEKFLDIYNFEKRKDYGVWYTPDPVVQFIVRAVDDVLKKEFMLRDGLADTSRITLDDKGTQVHRVQILDPATGTGTFLAEVIKRIASGVQDVTGHGWSDYIEEDLIPRLHGFEVLMAPYVVCHIKLSMMLKELVYKPNDESKRLSVYLTNSLESGDKDIHGLFYPWFMEEVKSAAEIKSKKTIMCVIGNPPYLAESGKSEGWFGTLMKDYKKEPGGKVNLDERNPKWLNDLYVKFIRMSSHLIEQNGEGILGFITNHGYLDNPTFRGMRWHLMQTFDSIHVLDLHGNSNKKEVAPDGTPDSNVFDIQQGVAILIAVKTKGGGPELAKVYRGDLWGSRNTKYESLATGRMEELVPNRLDVRGPQYAFKRRDHALAQVYEQGFSITEFMPVNSAGIVTARDSLTIDESKERLWQRVQDFAQVEPENARAKYALGKDARDWKVAWAQADLNADLSPDNLMPVAYRPFDTRWTYYTGKDRGFLCRPRRNVMRHMLAGENPGLVFCRGDAEGNSASAHVTNTICDSRLWTRPGMQSIDYLAPLYLYPDEQNLDTTRRINFDPAMWDQLKTLATYPEHDTPDELQTFDYIYGTLHSPSYRATYAEFLKTDFPRIPWPATPDAFWDISTKGAALRKLHLMDPAAIGDTPYPLEGDGDNNVGKPRFDNGKVWINKTRYFANVPDVAWEFYIGGYQPAQKWLKDRKGRTLGLDDIRHYQSILKILSETDRLMQEIDICQPGTGQAE
ncbi:MAG: N-6 DNA methylase [Rhodobacteraceae bacterium]|nr:N-6 DNA methylase [Paracoccaceae bacterium]